MSYGLLPTLEKWLKIHESDIKTIQNILAESLPDDPGRLDLMLRDVDSWYERMNSLYADALSLHDTAKKAALASRAEGYTDLDREVMMRAETADHRRLVHTLEGIVEAVKSRLMLGMSLRKSYVGEGHAGNRVGT